MTERAADVVTVDSFVELLAEVGELDAGAEVLEAWRVREPGLANITRLQALLFDAADPGPIARGERLAQVHPSSVDELARQGALLEAVVVLRVLVRAFPEESLWREKLGRMEAILAPLPHADSDPRREAVDAMVARGEISGAYAALRDLCREARDPVLEQRAELLRGLLFEPAHTRPYRALAGEEATRVLSPHLRGATSPDVRKTPPHASPRMLPSAVGAPVDGGVVRLRRAIDEGDLEEALTEANGLQARSPSPRWLRLCDALMHLRAMQTASEPSPATGKMEVVDKVSRYVREGRLKAARALARTLMAEGDTEVAARLSPRLADLDVVLDGVLPTPIPPKGKGPVLGGTPLEVAIVRDRNSERPSAPEGPRPSITAQHRKVVRLGEKPGSGE